MMNDANSFTCDEEMEFLQAGDNTTQITGVIVRIDPPYRKSLSKDFGKDLKRKQENLKKKIVEDDEVDNTPLRAILSNMSNKNIRVLFWNDKKKEFDGKILNQVVKISRGLIVYANPMYIKPFEDLMDREVSVQKYTSVEILGPWVSERKKEEDFQSIHLKDCGSFVGQFISVRGYIKTSFGSIIKGNSSYGSGALTDCNYRLLVNITSFEDSSNSFPEGSHVEIKGKLRSNENNTVILQVRNLQFVEKIDEVTKSTAEMSKGYVPIREIEEDQTNHQEYNLLRRKSGETDDDVKMPLKKVKSSSTDLTIDTEELDDLLNKL